MPTPKVGRLLRIWRAEAVREDIRQLQGGVFPADISKAHRELGIVDVGVVPDFIPLRHHNSFLKGQYSRYGLPQRHVPRFWDWAKRNLPPSDFEELERLTAENEIMDCE